MVYSMTKDTNLGLFLRALEWKMFVYITAIWYAVWPFCVHSLWYFFPFWYVWTKKNLVTLIKHTHPPPTPTFFKFLSCPLFFFAVK
jgi:hypothetical protein